MSRAPYAGQDVGKLTYEQRQEREKWMMEQASRLISSRQTKPYKPFTPSYPTPDAFDAEGAERARVAQIASQLAAALTKRDKDQGR